MSTPVLDRVSVEAWLPSATDAFRLNHSTLGDGVLAPNDTYGWLPIHGEAINVEIQRGGSHKGLTFSPYAGTLTATLLDSPEIGLRPGVPLRVRDGVGTTLFTATVQDLHRQNERIGATAETREYTTLFAADAVQRVANLDRYGAVVSRNEYDHTQHEFFPERIDRYLSGLGMPYEVAPNIEAFWDGTALVLDSFIASNVDWAEVPPTNRDAGYGRLSLWGNRTYSGSDFSGTVRMDSAVFGIQDVRGIGEPVTFTVWARLSPRPTPPNSPPFRIGVYREGQIIAQTTHTLTERWQPISLTVTGQSWSSLFFGADAWTEPSGSTNNAFEVTLASVIIGEGAENVARHPLQSIVYESTIGNHLDVTTASVRGGWWVDRQGVIQARAGTQNQPVLHLADHDGGDYCYVAIDHSFDTAGVVNVLSLNNHGRKEDPDEPGNFIADDRTLPAQRDASSIATFGHRAEQVETAAAYDWNQPSQMAGAWRRLAIEYVSDFASAQWMPRRVRLYITENPPLLDVQDRVLVSYKGNGDLMTVVSIKHEITRDSWHIDLELMP